jgi:hypothetical protein
MIEESSVSFFANAFLFLSIVVFVAMAIGG